MTFAFFRRHVAAHLAPLLLLALVVAAVAFLAAAAPRAVDHLLTDNVRHEVGSLLPERRDLAAREIGAPTPGDGADTRLQNDVARVWGSLDSTVQQTHDRLPATLRDVVGRPSFAVGLVTGSAVPPDPEVSRPFARVVPSFDPRLAEHVHIVEGTLPRPVAHTQPGPGNVDIVLSRAAATRMKWQVGATWSLTIGEAPTVDVRLSGTYEPVDPHDPIWEHEQPGLEPNVIEPGGGAVPIVTAIGWIDPASYPRLLPLAATAEVRAWFPLDARRLRADTADDVSARLREVGRSPVPVAGGEATNDFAGVPRVISLTSLGFDSGTPKAIADADRSGAATTALIALLASGPTGAAAALLALAVRGLGRRERSRLVLLRSRGATAVQLRVLRALEGLLVGVPGAVIGAVAALLLVDGSSTAAWTWPAAIALVPAVLLAAAPLPGVAPRRDDLVALRGASVVELVTGIATIAAVLLLRQRGLSADGPVRIDPLLAATPLLLALSVAFLVRRVQPVVARWAMVRAARRPEADALVGAARGLRDPSTGTAAVVALVTSVAITVFSAAAVASVQGGVDDEARRLVGADVRIDNALALDADDVATWRGIDEVAGLRREGGMSVTADGKPVAADVLFADVAALRRVQADVPDHLRLPAALGRDQPTALASSEVADQLPGRVEIGGVAVKVVRSKQASTPSLTDRLNWLMMDAASAQRAGISFGSPQRLLVSSGRTGEIERMVGARKNAATITTPDDVAETLRDRPILPGVVTAALSALAAVVVLCAAALLLTLAAGEADRARQMGLLRAIGRRGGGTRVVAWEVGPSVLLAVVSGTLLGLLLPLALLDRVDLAAFTTGPAAPAVRLVPGVAALTAAGALVLVALAALLTSRLSRRARLTDVLRMMED